jgi:hypothetical protein
VVGFRVIFRVEVMVRVKIMVRVNIRVTVKCRGRSSGMGWVMVIIKDSDRDMFRVRFKIMVMDRVGARAIAWARFRAMIRVMV